MSGVEFESTIEDKNYAKAMDKAIEAALVEAGAMLEDQAALLAAKDTGRLQGSITFATKKEQSNVRPPDKPNPKAGPADAVSKPGEKWVLHVGTNVEYAPYVEYGTRLMQGNQVILNNLRAQPFLRPALQELKHKITRDFGKWVEEHLRRGK